MGSMMRPQPQATCSVQRKAWMQLQIRRSMPSARASDRLDTAPPGLCIAAALAVVASMPPNASAIEMANSPYNLTDTLEYGVTARG